MRSLLKAERHKLCVMAWQGVICVPLIHVIFKKSAYGGFSETEYSSFVSYASNVYSTGFAPFFFHLIRVSFLLSLLSPWLKFLCEMSFFRKWQWKTHLYHKQSSISFRQNQTSCGSSRKTFKIGNIEQSIIKSLFWLQGVQMSFPCFSHWLNQFVYSIWRIPSIFSRFFNISHK